MSVVPEKLVELHLHLEGCLTPARARALWERSPGIAAPPLDGLQVQSWSYDGLGSFLQLFGWAVRLLDGPRAYVELLDDTVAMLEEQGVVYAELFVAIGVMHYFGIDPHAVLPALAQRAQEHEARGGVQLNFIADGVRQFGAEKAERVLEDALALRQSRIVGFGLGGDENAVPAAAFAGVYQRAREAGLGTSLHAGEGSDPQPVSEALALGVDRIGHGIAAASDVALMQSLVEEGTVLEVCPGSNLRTGAWRAKDGPHPIHRLLAQGVRLVLGSDDPAFFETSLRREFESCAREGMAEAELRALNTTAVEAAFLPLEARRALRRRVC